MEFSQKRIFGLDLVRSIAILLVLCAHGLDFFLAPVLEESFIGRIINRSLSFPLGFFGVELFFILSGFLIGGLIIKELVEDGHWRNLLNFYFRRWIRTLPLYYLVVLLLVLFPVGAGFTWENLFFIQNFNSDTLAFNPVSWSLSVEEWFYFTIPLIMLLTFRFIKGNKRTYFMGVSLSIIILSLIARILLVVFTDPSFDFGVRKQILFRLDSIMFGVILAGIKFYYKNLYRKIVDNRKKVFIISMVALVLCEIWFVLHRDRITLDQSLFSRTFFFDIVSISCALFVISLETIKCPRIIVVGKVITTISILSYGVYLLHFGIYTLMKKLVTVNSIFIGITSFVVSTVVVFILSTIIYKFYELPIMNLRNKLKIKNTYEKEVNKISKLG
ncbi:acyltransferase family protein [Bacillus cereus group sp. MYBK134-1]|uniref:acyltransferase family protein n=1 Tax=unclassified Bacillus cereus group TaxID=2750818 RepID=UPI003F79E06A